MLKNERNAYTSPQVRVVNVGPRKLICLSNETESDAITSMGIDKSEDDSAFN